MLNVIQYSKALFRINNNLNNYLVNSLILIDKIEFDNNIINEENNSIKDEIMKAPANSMSKDNKI